MVNLKSNFQQYFGFLVAHLSDDGAISSDTGDQRPTTKQLFLYCCESGMYMYDDDAVCHIVCMFDGPCIYDDDDAVIYDAVI